MAGFSVWAPFPKRVDLVIGGEPEPMAAAAGGWWSLDREAPPGTRYAFSLDGGPPRADPRSLFQPQGVDGPSEVVDHTAFDWHDSAWGGFHLPGSVLYEMHVGTFSPEGTFDGAVQLLPHLVELGIDAVELLPVNEFSGNRGWGYDGVDLFAPHHAYGGPEGLKRLVDACHLHGIGVIVDVVYNHLGPAGNYLPEFGPYFSERHRTNWGPAVNFDGPGSLEVRRFVIDNAQMWLRDYHCDGLRLDAVHAFVDESAVNILEELSEDVENLAAHLRRPLWLMPETDLNDPRFVRSRQAGGYGLDAAWADEWHHAVHATLTGETEGYYSDFGPISLLARALRQAWVYDGRWSAHRGRIHGRSPAGLSGHRFVVGTQNHDQVGNRALGERSAVLMSEGRLMAAAAWLLTSPFVPLLFMGEEWAAQTPFLYFTDHPDPDLGKAVSEGRRAEFASFGWNVDQIPDPQDAATFERSRLDWGEPAEPSHTGMLTWYRTLIRLRRNHPELTDARLERVEVRFHEAEGWIVVERGPVWVLVNLGPETIQLEVGDEAVILAASDPAVEPYGSLIALPSDSTAIVRQKMGVRSFSTSG